MIAPRRDNWTSAVLPDFRLSGFYFEEGFDPIPVEILDKQTGRRTRLTVIGILKDTAPLEMVGISTSQETLVVRSRAVSGRRSTTSGSLRASTRRTPLRARSPPSVANGLEAESIQQVVDDATAANLTFNRLVQGFLGLGLIVGVAALGVISARAVVERRQQIGVMRAIGFRTRMVQAAFLLESSFIALTSILAGTALGLLLAWNIIRDQRRNRVGRTSSSLSLGRTSRSSSSLSTP